MLPFPKLTEPQLHTILWAAKNRRSLMLTGHPRRMAFLEKHSLIRYIEECQHEETGRMMPGYNITALGMKLLSVRRAASLRPSPQSAPSPSPPTPTPPGGST